MIFTIAGNFFFVLAVLAYALLISPIVSGESQHGANHGAGMLAYMVTPFLWAALCIAFSFVIAAGGTDWIHPSRAVQFSVVLASLLGICVVAFFSAALWGESISQGPWTMGHIKFVGIFVFPILTILSGFLAVNSKLFSSSWAWRAPLVLAASISLLAGVSMLFEALASWNRRQVARVEELHQRDRNRDANLMKEVEAMDTVQDFGKLLQFTNRWETPAIQELAVKKVLAHPEFTKRLAECLQDQWVGEAMYFVDAHDPPDPKPIAEPLRYAIIQLAGYARKRMSTEDRMFEDTFDSEAQRILNAADRLAPQGVDYVPAIREYRAAMDTSREGLIEKVKPSCRGLIDRWLAAHSKK